MESIVLGKTHRTPGVNFDANTGILELSGRSIPENALAFYQPLLDWIDEYQQAADHKIINAIFRLEYFNTSSSKCLLDLLRKLETVHQEGIQVNVQWYYDTRDEDMEEAGKDFQDLIETDFELIPLP
ncbi:MAG: DUF1987 domain-containing protein [Bacteroidota bacterium]